MSEFGLLTRFSLCQFCLQVVALLLQVFDVTPLAKEEIGNHCLAHDQHTGQQGQSCHLVGAGGAATGKQEENESERRCNLNDMSSHRLIKLFFFFSTSHILKFGQFQKHLNLTDMPLLGFPHIELRGCSVFQFSHHGTKTSRQTYPGDGTPTSMAVCWLGDLMRGWVEVSGSDIVTQAQTWKHNHTLSEKLLNQM